MARFTLQIPTPIIATIVVPVRITDINYGNHVGNDAFAGILHEARMQWLHQAGYTELDIAGKGLIMSDLAIVFHREGYYGDQLTITLHPGELSRVAFELYYTVYASREGETLLLATARTGMVHYDYTARKAAALSPEILALLQIP